MQGLLLGGRDEVQRQCSVLGLGTSEPGEIYFSDETFTRKKVLPLHLTNCLKNSLGCHRILYNLAPVDHV